ncbi:MAG TPA: hypothetical protein VF021_11700 [Longimicrobiales bacterium]
MRVDADRSYLSRHGSVALWFALLGAPCAWFLGLVLSYPVVPYACYSGHVWTLYAISAIALLVVLGAGVVGYGLLMDTGAELPGDHASHTDRTRLLAAVGMMFSGLFALILIGHIASTAMVGPCIPLPRERFTPDAYVEPAGHGLIAQSRSMMLPC